MNKDVSLNGFSNLTHKEQIRNSFLRNRCYFPYGTGERLVICDLDDVLFYTNFIFDEIESLKLSGEEKWNYFHENVSRCPVNYNIYCLLTGIEGYARIIFLTARSETIKFETMEKLYRVLDFSPVVIFRKENDKRESWEVKEDIVKNLLNKFEILFAIDDDISNCKMYALHGIPVLHVYNAEGRVCPYDTKAVKTLAMSLTKSD